MRKPVILIVMDGWGKGSGRGPGKDDDAIAGARTPVFDSLYATYPNSTLSASGEDVGLPEGQMGNSEVGHLNLGAGRIVYQDFTRINLAIRNGEFFKNKVFLSAMSGLKAGGGALHLLGLVSDGGVHSHQNHIYALIRMARDSGVGKIFVHAFLDGRDTPPKSGAGYLEMLRKAMAETGAGKIATISGRYYAMDRDNRWDRVEKAYRAMVRGDGRRSASVEAAMEEAYGKGETDEFVLPTVIGEGGGVIGEGDAVIVFNFRPDRVREITRAMTQASFDAFDRGEMPRLTSFSCMTVYDAKFGLPAAFPPQKLEMILGETISMHNLKQLRIAETEKYAHVTYFFNGGVEKVFPGEERILIPSPKDVPTYDLKPQMSAVEVADALVEKINSGNFDFLLVNFANADMVGHTGNFQAAVAAVETVDLCVGRVLRAIRDKGGAALVTSDHGNAEQMKDPLTGQPHTAHTSNPVPVILVDDHAGKGARLRKGILADAAPTILEIMGLPRPPEMEGSSLIIA